MDRMATEHPYFIPAQLYQLRQAKPGTTEYDRLLALNSLLFHNDRLLFLRLQPDTAVQVDTVSPAPGAAKTTSVEEQPVLAEATPTVTVSADPIAESMTAAELPVAEPPMTTADVLEAAPTYSYHLPTDTTSTPASEVAEVPEMEADAQTTPPVESLTTDAISAAPLTSVSDNPAEVDIAPAETKVQAPQDNTGDTFPGKLSLNLPPQKNAPLFEPYHTVDYFAALGIRLSEDPKPADPLGIKLKSFTEWLKSMKKIHEQAKSTPISDETQEAIQHIAEKSNMEDEVVTEAMAEVYLQQGNTRRAIRVYEKLSLLNPAKSAYFATQIEKVKRNLT
jgi:hypothetical protein